MDGDIYVFHPGIDDPSVLHRECQVQFLGRCEELRRPRIAKYFDAAQEIERLTRRYDKVDVYVPHPYNPLSNHAFFHSRVDERYIYQDGLLNYYDASSPLTSWRRRLGRTIRAVAAGFDYQTYAGHLSGVDSRPVSGGFFTHPYSIVRAEKFPSLTCIDFHHSVGAKFVTGDATLFLDQPVEEVMGPNVAIALRRKTLEYVNSLGGRVYYKPHYSQKRAGSFDRSWHLLEGDLAAMPAERATAMLGVANVVSFFTSALANIAIIDNSVICHATSAHMVPVTIDGRSATLADVLSGFGVKIVALH